MADYGTIFSGASGEVWLADGSHFQDTARTTAAANGDPVGSLTGTLGNFNSEGTTTARPTLTVSGGKTWLDFNGSANVLTAPSSTAAFNWMHNSAGDGYLCAAVRFGAVADPATIYCLLGNSAGSSANIGFIAAYEDRTSQPANNASRLSVSRGTAGTFALNSIVDDTITPVADVVCEVIKSGTSVTVYINGVQVDSGSLASPSASSASFDLQIGSTGAGNLLLLGRIYGLVVTDTIPSAADRTAIQDDMSLRTVDNPMNAVSSVYAHNVAAFLMSGLL